MDYYKLRNEELEKELKELQIQYDKVCSQRNELESKLEKLKQNWFLLLQNWKDYVSIKIR